jgi:hypothetical protein
MIPPIHLNTIMAIPAVRRSDLEAVIERGTNPHPPEKAFNNGALTDGALIPLVTGTNHDIEHVNSSVTLTSGICRLKMMFANVPYTDAECGRLFLKIEVFDDYKSPVSAFTNDLLRYQRPLSEVTSPMKNPLGALALTTSSSISWVRGNHFVQLSLEGSSKPDPAVAIDLEALARRIDTYLQSNTVLPPEHRKPSLRLETPLPTTAHVGDAFTVVLADRDLNATQTHALSSDSSIVLPQGPADEKGTFTFYAQRAGKAELTLVVAHAETLHPRFETHVVQVVE